VLVIVVVKEVADVMSCDANLRSYLFIRGSPSGLQNPNPTAGYIFQIVSCAHPTLRVPTGTPFSHAKHGVAFGRIGTRLSAAREKSVSGVSIFIKSGRNYEIN